MSDEPLPSDFAHMPCGGWCVGECPGCCECGNTGCSGCQHNQLATGGIVSSTARLRMIGEESCTLDISCRSVRTGAKTYELHFDTSPETLQRLRDALRGGPGRQ